MAKQENGDKPHSIRYIRQMIEWGFDKEFIAKDCGINVSSLDVRLNRAKKREQDGNQRTESGTSSGESDS